MSDPSADFVPIEPTPAVAQPVAPPPEAAPAPPQATTPPAPPQPPAGYYSPAPQPPYPPAQTAPGQAAPGYPGAGYPGGYPGAGYPAQYVAASPPTGLAIASMILGIAGTFFSFFYGFGLFPAIAAVITGHMARKRQPYARGFWLTGLITGYIGIAIAVLWIIGLIVVFAILIPQANNGSNDF